MRRRVPFPVPALVAGLTASLLLAADHPEAAVAVAHVKAANVASAAAFDLAGFSPVHRRDDILQYGGEVDDGW